MRKMTRIGQENLMDKYSIEEIRSMKAKEIRSVFDSLKEDEYQEFISVFSLDERKSSQMLCSRLEKKIEKLREEDLRLEAISKYENEAYLSGYECVAGIDEVGRGPLAGPVVAAVVILKKGTKIRGINDSKKIAEPKREELYDIIIDQALDYGIGMATPQEIDEHNILNATYIAMRRAIGKLRHKPDCLLNDAVRIPGVDIHQVPIIKGDSKSISIGAASIVAKVTRDRMMYDYDREYPGYNFSSNKGYGTTDHYDGIRSRGRCPIHRESFLKNFRG